MLNITNNYDEFTGDRIVKTSLIGISPFSDFADYKPSDDSLPNVSNVFLALSYSGNDSDVEAGIYAITIAMSMDIERHSEHVPGWSNKLLLIIDGERTQLDELGHGEYETIKSYTIPLYLLQKMAESNEVKYSLRGTNFNTNGVLQNEHIKFFKAFYSYCKGNEEHGELILNHLNSLAHNQEHRHYDAIDSGIHDIGSESLKTDSPIEHDEISLDAKDTPYVRSISFDTSSHHSRKNSSSQTTVAGVAKSRLIFLTIFGIVSILLILYFVYDNITDYNPVVNKQSIESSKSSDNNDKYRTSSRSNTVTQTDSDRSDEISYHPVDRSTSKKPGLYPIASERLLTHEDLVELSKTDLKIMRNEIYARHGMIFKTDDMRKYFNAQLWYKGIYTDVSGSLSETELANVNMILRYEK